MIKLKSLVTLGLALSFTSHLFVNPSLATPTYYNTRGEFTDGTRFAGCFAFDPNNFSPFGGGLISPITDNFIITQSGTLLGTNYPIYAGNSVWDLSTTNGFTSFQFVSNPSVPTPQILQLYIPGSAQGFTGGLLTNVSSPPSLPITQELIQTGNANYPRRQAVAGSITLAPLSNSSQSNPILPCNGSTQQFVFNNVPTGAWFDPPAASAYTYTMNSGSSLFTDILNFPTGYSNLVVTANGITLGTFNSGQSVNFINLLGSGVTSFTISGIAPPTDPNDPLAFPLQLAFSTPTASFTQTPIIESSTQIPEPSSPLSLVALLGFLYLSKKEKILN